MQPSPGSFLSSERQGWALFDPPRSTTMSCSTLAMIVAGIVIALIFACRYDHISVAERNERKFQRWKRRHDRKPNGSSPPDDDP